MVTCAACGKSRERHEMTAYYSDPARILYVCRPTLRMESAPEGSCFRKAVCWTGHHAIKP